MALGMTPRDVMLGLHRQGRRAPQRSAPVPRPRRHPGVGRVYNLSNVVATQIPQAVGAALSFKMRGEDAVVIVYFGDGASSVGDCHEGMNFAAIHSLPVVFFCENNKYAISVPLAKQMAVDSVAGRAEGYGMPGIAIDGSDVAAVYEATSEAAVPRPPGRRPHRGRGHGGAVPPPHQRRRRLPLQA